MNNDQSTCLHIITVPSIFNRTRYKLKGGINFARCPIGYSVIKFLINVKQKRTKTRDILSPNCIQPSPPIIPKHHITCFPNTQMTTATSHKTTQIHNVQNKWAGIRIRNVHLCWWRLVLVLQNGAVHEQFNSLICWWDDRGNVEILAEVGREALGTILGQVQSCTQEITKVVNPVLKSR